MSTGTENPLNISDLRKRYDGQPWVEHITSYLSALFNDRTYQKNSMFIEYIQEKASEEVRSTITSQFCAQIYKIASSENPESDIRKWMVRLADEYAPLKVLTGKNSKNGLVYNYTGLIDNADKIISIYYTNVLDNQKTFKNAFETLQTRMLRIELDLEVANELLNNFSGGSHNKRNLIESACHHHCLRMLEKIEDVPTSKLADSLELYEQQQDMFLKSVN